MKPKLKQDKDLNEQPHNQFEYVPSFSITFTSTTSAIEIFISYKYIDYDGSHKNNSLTTMKCIWNTSYSKDMPQYLEEINY